MIMVMYFMWQKKETLEVPLGTSLVSSHSLRNVYVILVWLGQTTKYLLG